MAFDYTTQEKKTIQKAWDSLANFLDNKSKLNVLENALKLERVDFKDYGTIRAKFKVMEYFVDGYHGLVTMKDMLGMRDGLAKAVMLGAYFQDTDNARLSEFFGLYVDAKKGHEAQNERHRKSIGLS